MRSDPNERSLTALVTDKGRITLPVRARKQLEIETGDRLAVVVRQNSLELIPLEGVGGSARWLLTRTVRAAIEGAEADVDSGQVVTIRSARSIRRAVRQLHPPTVPPGSEQTEVELQETEAAVVPPARCPTEVDSLLLTRQFAAAYDRLRPTAQRHCDRTLRRLLDAPSHPGVRLEPVPSPTGYHVLRFGFNDRAIVRFSGSTAILVDAFSFLEVARWNARAARRS